MNHHQHSLALQGGKPLVKKVPVHFRYAGFFNVLLGLALLATLAALGYASALLQQFMDASTQLEAKVAELEQQPDNRSASATNKPPVKVTDFCPFPINPANPACQIVVAANDNPTEPSPMTDSRSATDAQAAAVAGQNITPLGWIYAGRSKLQKAVQLEEESILAGQIYTLLQNLNVRRLPVSSKTAENRQVLSTVFAGEQVRVLAQENTGEHLWLQIARP